MVWGLGKHFDHFIGGGEAAFDPLILLLLALLLDAYLGDTPWLFKRLQVVRFYDKPNNTLVYLSYSDKLIDGSPKNAISTVPIACALAPIARPNRPAIRNPTRGRKTIA